jgi:hypothetical protein
MNKINKKSNNIALFIFGIFVLIIIEISVFFYAYVSTLNNFSLIPKQFVFPLFLIVSSVLIIVLITWRKKNGSKKKIILAVTIILLVITPFLSKCFVEYSITSAKSEAGLIINAVNEYEDTEGHFPNALIELEPEYLLNIPQYRLVFLRDYGYSSDSLGYYISFYEIDGFVYIYSSNINDWYRKD